ncbi:putative secreted protein (Por secretion system target) [Aquimarina sp. MAR_2010_214]|uniref:T9SS type A sorting domain-containing protein n=1 Tax=Aquimarina sp. MAR_2010_214 TaxID=1250026 RepID=UPI000C7056AF|nr:T9SS type A sorting domain-containing protein [Aquimarina sp. MAR_2010_214]PKV52469.1 putative secreted protein (Por secretion system target) [Aquimarina sp. MAR_2010_214]
MKSLFFKSLLLLSIPMLLQSQITEKSNLANISLQHSNTTSNPNYITIVDNDCSSMADFLPNQWGISTSQFVSTGGSITDSPNRLLSSGTFSPLQLEQEIDLTSVTAAFVEFKAKWELQKFFDYVQFDVLPEGAPSFNGWEAQHGLHTKLSPVAGTQFQPLGEPIYNLVQSDWVQEKIDLSKYIGQKIHIRFYIAALTYVGGRTDGFYFDDLKVKVLPDPDGNTNNTITLLEDDCNSLDNFIIDDHGQWGVDTSRFLSPIGSIHDTPMSDLQNATHTKIEFKQSIDLTSVNDAYAEFYFINYMYPHSWDEFVQFQVKLENEPDGDWEALSGINTRPAPAPGNEPWQKAGAPLYGGVVSNWIHEKVDLSKFDGQKIHIRFLRGGRKPHTGNRGFAFDNFKVKGSLKNKQLNTLNNNALLSSTEETLRVYPNPTSDYIIINSSIKDSFFITIKNAQGQKIKTISTTNNSIKINVSSFANGIYFISIQTSKTQRSIKFLKQ